MTNYFRTHLGYLKNEKGQSIVILAGSIVALIAMLGFALDLGMLYSEKVNLKKAIDAAALSSVIELSNEESAILRAIEYLQMNGYSHEETNFYVMGCIPGKSDTAQKNRGDPDKEPPFLYQMTTDADYSHDGDNDWFNDDVKNIFIIDTFSHQDKQSTTTCDPNTSQRYGTANRITITGTVHVPTNFMAIVPNGHQIMAAQEGATAQNVDKLDIIIVFDRSGSMEWQPVCTGCWQKAYEDSTAYKATVVANGEDPDYESPLRYWDYYLYPGNGGMQPLGSFEGAKHPVIDNACNAKNPAVADTVYVSTNSKNYMMLEAELYSFNRSSYEGESRAAGVGYWVFQRGEINYYVDEQRLSITQQPNVYAYGDGVNQHSSFDGGSPAHVSHYPFRTYEPALQTHGSIRCKVEAGEEICRPVGKHYSLSEAQNLESPMLRYDFQFWDDDSTVDWGNTAYLWVRVHGSLGLRVTHNEGSEPNLRELSGDNSNTIDDFERRNSAYWAVAYEPGRHINPNNYTSPPSSSLSISNRRFNPHDGTLNGSPAPGVTTSGVSLIPINQIQDYAAKLIEPDGKLIDPSKTHWQWIRLGGFPINPNTHAYSFYFFAGSSGFAIDRIVITDNDMEDSYPAVTTVGSGVDTGGALDISVDGQLYNLKVLTPTHGSAYGDACDYCNPIYGPRVVDYSPNPSDPTRYVNINNCLNDDYANLGDRLVDSAIFEDPEQPMRAAKQAVKAAVMQLPNPEFDQVGLVAYSGQSGTTQDPYLVKVQLECDRYRNQSSANNQCTETSPVYSYTEILKAIEEITPIGMTNTGAGMKAGLELLGVDLYNTPSGYNKLCDGSYESTCSRTGGVKKVLILITDGNPTSNPGGACTTGPTWNPNTADYRCPLYFAQQAQENGVTVHAIGVGYGVDPLWIQKIADYGNGIAGQAFTEKEIKILLAEIFGNIYVRLTD
ncbi:MAG: hypothetical protein B6242_03245 [Anaerolineaceae bacterium 4572_78]|nr:MAG: hypothetical protein B6242_03245 [Anaerolineaceae bacterium 4572_78]